MRQRLSAGILLYRRRDRVTEVLLGHPGGPFFVRKDAGHWTIPKGEPDGSDDLLAVARREFEEETGSAPPSANEAPPIDLGSIVQRGGKTVWAWAIEGDLDPAESRSNEFEMEWPPRSGRRQMFPEVDRVGWFGLDEARRVIRPDQVPLVDRLAAAIGSPLPDR
jgi:predicted NUDIX family NTP pyrophosphohydrolase